MSFSAQRPPRVVAAIPGRIRLRWPEARRDPDRLRRLAAELASLPGVRETTVVPAASSVVLRYPPRERDLDEIQRDALDCGLRIAGRGTREEGRGARDEGRETSVEGRGSRDRNPSTLAPRPPTPNTDSGTRIAQRAPELGTPIVVLEDQPGRVRLRIDRLKGHSQGWGFVEYRLGGEQSVDRVQADVDAGTVLISYDETAQNTQGIVRCLRQFLPEALKRKPGHAEIARLRDIPARRPTRIHPLLLPTAAVVLAAIDGVPAAITAGALALAAVPIAGRAAEGVRGRQFNVDQLDAANVGILAVQGNLVAASGIAWLIGLAEWIRGKVLRAARAAAVTAAERSSLRHDLAHLVENAPLSDTRLQSNAATAADRLSVPVAGLGALQFAAGGANWQAAGDAIGLIKPRSDFVSVNRFASPATVLRVLAAALGDRMLVRSGKALEKLAHPDVVVLDASAVRRGCREALAEALCRRGVREIVVVEKGRVRSLGGREIAHPALPEPVSEGGNGRARANGAEAFVTQRRAEKRVVAVVTAGELEPPVVSEADVVLALDPEQRIGGGDFIDVVLLDPDPLLVARSIDGSRRAVRILKQNLAIAGTGAAVNLAAGLLGVAPPAFSQAVTTSVVGLTGLNALRAGRG